MQRAIFNKSRRQPPLQGTNYKATCLPSRKLSKLDEPNTQNTCWRSRDELISDVLPWTPSYGWAKAGRPIQTYVQQLCEDTGYSPEDLPEAMSDREKWRERVKDIRFYGKTWWWYIYIYIYKYVCLCACVWMLNIRTEIQNSHICGCVCVCVR